MNTRKIETTSQGYLLNALEDAPDLRDLAFQPSLDKLRSSIAPPGGLVILNQSREGACTGFGLAAIINLQKKKRGDRYQVSPRMLYEMAKLHDEWPGENYAGSSCRGAIKGWYNMGVCSDSKWKFAVNRPGSLTVDRAKEARKNTVGAYYRVQPRISDFHAAINEAGAVYCSAKTHSGWQRPHKKTHIIPFDKTPRGGHAFAIVGYNNKGFWVQNSWGKRWGKSGLALWLYEDWQQNLMDAWVFNLALSTPQIWHLPDTRDANRSGISLKPSPPRSEIAGHFIHVDDGQFHPQGRYWSSAEDVRSTAKIVAENKKGYKHLLLYAHGGLNSPKASARRIAAMKQTFKDNDIYPYHFMYDTGILEELKDVILRHCDSAGTRAGGFSDWSDRLLEWAARIPGRALWREMKDGARLPFLPQRAGTDTLAIWLNEMAHKTGHRMKVHLCGHSTGAILLARLLESMEDLAPTLRIQSCTLLAPAASVALFESHYYPYLISRPGTFGIEKMQLFNLNDRLERDDNVGRIYRKSLLYLVSRGFEEAVPEAILGMQRHVDELLNKPKMAAVSGRFEAHYADGTPSSLTESTSHGGFDNDVATMNSLLHTILDSEPARDKRFTRELLDY